MPRLSVFIATSLDGYIATDDDGIDWLESAAAVGEDYGYVTFLDAVDALAMGRGTWDRIGHLDPLPFGDRPVFVFTHRPPATPRAGVTFWQVEPPDAADLWDGMGLGRVYVDGGALISSFLAAGLIDDLLVTTVPILLGSGRPLFHRIDRTTDLVLEDVQPFPSGLVNLRYSRRNGAGGG